MTGGQPLALAGLFLVLVGPPIVGLIASVVSAVLLWSRQQPVGNAGVAAACFVVGPAVLPITLALSPPGRPIFAAMACFVSVGLVLAGNAVSSTGVPDGAFGKVSPPVLYLAGVLLGGLATLGTMSLNWAWATTASGVVTLLVSGVWFAWSVACGPVLLLAGAARIPRAEGELR